MKKTVILIVCVLWTMGALLAQREASKSSELGITIGGSIFFGDLGGSSDIGRPFISDLDIVVTRPAVGIFFRRNFNNRLSFRISGYYTQVFGDDALSNADNAGQPGYPRKYRNLSFKSNIIELSGQFDINFMSYVVGSTRYRFTPYLTMGLGGIYFEPKANINGGWVKLRELGTEGQGLQQYPGKKVYSNIAMIFPVGLGIKYNMNEEWSFNFEIVHRFSNTDYVDDVSTTYANPAYFTDPLTAALADRSNGDNPNQTAPGQQRGNPANYDGYTLINFTFAYVLGMKGNPQYYCPKFF
jgi:opacity protein-like surface antigen